MTRNEVFAVIKKKAAELVSKSAGSLTQEQAVEEVCQREPALYQRFRDAEKDVSVAKAERSTVLKLAQERITEEIARSSKARGIDRGEAAVIVAKEQPELITLSKDPSSAYRTVNEATIRKSAALLETHLDLKPGKALTRALELDALPPPVPTVPVPHTPAVQKKDPTNEQIGKVIKICEGVMAHLEEEWDVTARRPVRKFSKAMTFNEVRALDRAAAA